MEKIVHNTTQFKNKNGISCFNINVLNVFNLILAKTRHNLLLP
jgi:hypothetical protein